VVDEREREEEGREVRPPPNLVTCSCTPPTPPDPKDMVCEVVEEKGDEDEDDGVRGWRR